MPTYLDGARPYGLLVLLCLALFLPGIAGLPVTDRDEARFAQATRQMLETGDFVQIRFQSEPRNKKPAGIYWAQAASVSVLSQPESRAIWPYRLPSVVGAVIAVLLTFLLGSRLFDRRTAFLGAAFLAGSLLLVVEAHIAKTDAALLATVIGAEAALAAVYLRAHAGKRRVWGWPLMFWAMLGVGGLIKGPITPMVALLTAAALKIGDRKTPLFGALRPLPGIALALAIFLPWLLAFRLEADASFVGAAVQEDLLPKLLGGQESHGFPPGYFLLLMTVTFWPASLFVWPALVWAWGLRRQPAIRFLFAWIVPSWLVFEIVPTKLPNYILPIYPALALLTARAVLAAQGGLIPRLRRWDGRAVILVWGAITVALAAGAVALPYLSDGGVTASAVIAALVALIVAAVATVYAWRGRYLRAAVAPVAGAVLFFGLLFQGVLPSLSGVWLSERAADMVSRHVAAPSARPPVIAAGYREPSLVFTFGTTTRLPPAGAIATLLRAEPDALALVTDRAEAEFLQGLAREGVAVKAVDSVEGFNYSKGRWLRLTLYVLDEAAED